MQFCSVNPGVGPGPCITLHRNSLFHVSLPVRVFCPPRQTFIPRRRRRRRQFSCKTSETQDVRKILSVFFFFPFFFFFHLLPAVSISLVFVIYLSLRLFLRRCLFPLRFFLLPFHGVRRGTGTLETGVRSTFLKFLRRRKKQGRTTESAPSSIPPARDFSSMKFRLFRV